LGRDKMENDYHHHSSFNADSTVDCLTHGKGRFGQSSNLGHSGTLNLRDRKIIHTFSIIINY